MFDILYFAQTLFYLTFSILIIVLGGFFIFIGYNIFALVRNLKKISDNIEHASADIKDNIMEILDRLASIPILSIFMGRKTGKRGDNKNNKKKSTKKGHKSKNK